MHPIFQRAQEIAQWIVEHRRHLHAIPELSGQEERTAAYCQAVLRELGWRVSKGADHGFWADFGPRVENPADMPATALRAELDALPVAEATGAAYASQNPGVSHACGHDAHMAMLLGAARLISERAKVMVRPVRLVLQPSEERFPGGARPMIEAGCLEGVAEIYGLHNAPDVDAGIVVAGSGPVMAACDNFHLTLTGRGCHGATPQAGLDPITAAMELVAWWRGEVAVRIAGQGEVRGEGRGEAGRMAVVSVCTFHAGKKENILPDEARLSGTVRTLEQGDRALVEYLLRDGLQALQGRGFRHDLLWERSFPAVVNHAAQAQRVLETAHALLGEDRVVEQLQPRAWAEDFSYYLQERPGAFFFLGGASPGSGVNEPLHSPRFNVDESALAAGAAVLAALAMSE